MEISYIIREIDLVAKQLLEHLSTKTLLLYGDMGVGKTTLIKALVKALGSTDTVSSPTFSIINEYQSHEDPIYHFDFYRINDINEVYNLGIEDYLYSNDWCLVEWPERIQSILPEYAERIDLVLNPDNSRTLTLNCKTNLIEKHMLDKN